MARPIRDADESLSLRAAWLHYAAGLTQAEVARRLGVPSLKAHRLIARAVEAGVVKVAIDGEPAECAALAEALAARHRLEQCEVAPDLGEEGLPSRALGVAGAAFLQRAIEAHEGGLIGVGHGRTLAAVVEDLPRMDAKGARFVSLLGGLARNYAVNPHDVMHRLAAKTRAEAWVMPIPFFANSAEDREILLAQRGVAEVFALAARADLMIVGVGAAEPGAQIAASGMIAASDIAEVKAQGGVGEVLGHFFDAQGRALETPLTARTLSLDLNALRGRRIVAIAGGAEKIAAIRSVLRSGLLSGLITDERTAGLLQDQTP